MDLREAATPALVLDRARLQRNCERMIARCRGLGVRLRPHMKTLKSIDAARIAIDPEHGGIAVSTLQEADYFAARGIEDIQYAVCITPDKLDRAAGIAARVRRFGVFLDSVEAARAVAEHPGAERLGVWIEIDSGEHRTGLLPDCDKLTEIAEVITNSPSRLAGVATHGGHSYRARDPDSIAAVAEEERQAVVAAATRLRDTGFEVPGVSAGSTPTAVHSRSGERLTELRPGVYMAGDLFQSAVGSIDEDEIAASVLATVISHKPEQNQIVIDAGGIALSKDRSTAALEGGDLGYGLVVDVEGRPSFGRLVVAGVSQEHGEIRSGPPLPFERLPIGAKVRVLPNHVCMTAAAHDRSLVVDGGSEIVATWERVNGW